MPSFFIMAFNVVRGMPRRLAATLKKLGISRSEL
jgi:hypothetical protein